MTQTASRTFHLRAGTHTEREVWCRKIARIANITPTSGEATASAGDGQDHIALLRLKLEAGKISEHEYNHLLACYNVTTK